MDSWDITEELIQIEEQGAKISCVECSKIISIPLRTFKNGNNTYFISNFIKHVGVHVEREASSSKKGAKRQKVLQNFFNPANKENCNFCEFKILLTFCF